MDYNNIPAGTCGAISKASNSQVMEGFSDLSKSIGNLDDLLMRMGDKINPVLRAESVIKGALGAPECELVPLASELRNYRQKIDRAADQVQSWLGRIEL